MKKVKLFELKERERENALNEVRILASYNDPYIINYKVISTSLIRMHLLKIINFV